MPQYGGPVYNEIEMEDDDEIDFGPIDSTGDQKNTLGSLFDIPGP